jgi:hypothetical protein
MDAAETDFVPGNNFITRLTGWVEAENSFDLYQLERIDNLDPGNIFALR